jgi:prepilin-type N-terminal cleavage/methylation domain-containing protein
MKKKSFSLNQKGFTLIEMLSIMIIMGVMGSVATQKFDILSDTASKRALETAVKEINIRESLAWSNMKISTDGYTTDEDVFAALDKELGPKLIWNPGPTIGGGTLHCESESRVLTRIASTNISAGRWQ